MLPFQAPQTHFIPPESSAEPSTSSQSTTAEIAALISTTEWKASMHYRTLDPYHSNCCHSQKTLAIFFNTGGYLPSGVISIPTGHSFLCPSFPIPFVSASPICFAKAWTDSYFEFWQSISSSHSSINIKSGKSLRLANLNHRARRDVRASGDRAYPE